MDLHTTQYAGPGASTAKPGTLRVKMGDGTNVVDVSTPAGLGTGTWSNFGPMLAELFPTALRNAAMGSILNLARGVQFVAPVLIATLEPRYGLASGIGLAAVFAALAALFVWTLPETRGTPLATIR